MGFLWITCSRCNDPRTNLLSEAFLWSSTCRLKCVPLLLCVGVCYHPYSNLAFLISYIHYLIRACNPWNHHQDAVPRESKLFIHISAIWKMSSFTFPLTVGYKLPLCLQARTEWDTLTTNNHSGTLLIRITRAPRTILLIAVVRSPLVKMPNQ